MTGAMGNVAVTSTGGTGAMDAGGNYTAEVLAELAARADDDARSWCLGGTPSIASTWMRVKLVTFTYSAAMVQPTVGDATFAVVVDGGAGPGTDLLCQSQPISKKVR